MGGSRSWASAQPAPSWQTAAVDATTGVPNATFKPTVNAVVLGLAVHGSDVYLGGTFTTVNGVARTDLVALNGSSGSTDPAFTASADAEVQAVTMTADGSKLVIGGSSQNHIAALNPTTGATTSWASHTP